MRLMDVNTVDGKLVVNMTSGNAMYTVLMDPETLAVDAGSVFKMNFSGDGVDREANIAPWEAGFACEHAALEATLWRAGRGLADRMTHVPRERLFAAALSYAADRCIGRPADEKYRDCETAFPLGIADRGLEAVPAERRAESAMALARTALVRARSGGDEVAAALDAAIGELGDVPAADVGTEIAADMAKAVEQALAFRAGFPAWSGNGTPWTPAVSELASGPVP